MDFKLNCDRRQLRAMHEMMQRLMSCFQANIFNHHGGSFYAFGTGGSASPVDHQWNMFNPRFGAASKGEQGFRALCINNLPLSTNAPLKSPSTSCREMPTYVSIWPRTQILYHPNGLTRVPAQWIAVRFAMSLAVFARFVRVQVCRLRKTSTALR